MYICMYVNVPTGQTIVLSPNLVMGTWVNGDMFVPPIQHLTALRAGRLVVLGKLKFLGSLGKVSGIHRAEDLLFLHFDFNWTD